MAIAVGTAHGMYKGVPKIHYDIIENIKKISGIDVKLNNALIEIYGSKYCTMGYHSDQSLDLDEKSYICIFIDLIFLHMIRRFKF